MGNYDECQKLTLININVIILYSIKKVQLTPNWTFLNGGIMKKIITISREFASGGRELGKKLSEELNIPFYDSELINLLSKKTGLSEEYISKTTETRIINPVHNFARSFSINTSINNNKMELLIAQQKVLKEIAEIGDCIIVGRAADVILKEYNPFKIFVYCDVETKVKRCFDNMNENEKLTEKEIIKKAKEIDKNRQKYYDIISDNTWGEKENYNLCVNTSNIDIKDLIQPLSLYIKNYYNEVL